MNGKYQVFQLHKSDGTTEDIALVAQGCQYFFNAQHLYLHLSSKERCYFDYLCEIMDYGNRILLDTKLRADFISHFNALTSSNKAPSSRTLLRFEEKLISLKLLITYKSKLPVHFVNPKYVFKRPLKERPILMNRLSWLAADGEIDVTTIMNSPNEPSLNSMEQNEEVPWDPSDISFSIE